MSLIIRCDKCGGSTPEDALLDEEGLLGLYGITKQDYGHTCATCTEDLFEAEQMEDTASGVPVYFPYLKKAKKIKQ